MQQFSRTIKNINLTHHINYSVDWLSRFSFTFSNLSENLLGIHALVLIGVVLYSQFSESLFYLAVSCCGLHI